MELLRFEMEDLKSLDFDLDLAVFGEEELARILEPAKIEGLTDPHSVPDLLSNSVTVPGDLWIWGKHRLHYRCARNFILSLKSVVN
jgi:hypothetical protein